MCDKSSPDHSLKSLAQSGPSQQSTLYSLYSNNESFLYLSTLSKALFLFLVDIACSPSANTIGVQSAFVSCYAPSRPQLLLVGHPFYSLQLSLLRHAIQLVPFTMAPSAKSNHQHRSPTNLAQTFGGNRVQPG